MKQKQISKTEILFKYITIGEIGMFLFAGFLIYMNYDMQDRYSNIFNELNNVRGFNDIQPHHIYINFSVNNSLYVDNVDSCDFGTGSSMRPTLFTGNIICYMNYTEDMRDLLNEGMIIGFSNINETTNETYNTIHRIKAIYPDEVLLQGDNNRFSEMIKYEQIKKIAIAILLA